MPSNKIFLIISIIIISILIISAIVLAIIFIIKGKGKNKYVNKVDHLLSLIDIDNKSQMKAYLVRLKNIANNNETYVDIYQQMNSQYEMLIGVERDKLVARHRGLKDRIASEPKIKKNIIEQIKSFENAVNNYIKEIKRMKNDLESYFKQGDELRIKLTSLQEKYQQIISETNKYSSSLSICKKELDSYLADIEMYFDIFDSNLAGAYYNEALKNLQTIENLILNVYGHIETIAQYCKMVDVIIPNQLDDLVKKNNDLKEKGYVVVHCKVNEFVENTLNILEGCKKDFKHLCFSNFDEISCEIQEKLSEVHARLDQEVISKDNLEVKYQVVNERVNKVLSDFITTKRQFATMLDYYKIPSSFYEKFKEFEKNATYLTSIRIEYEGLMLLSNKHPASYMLSKLQVIDDYSNSINDDISFFTTYFKNIKEFVEDAFLQTNSLLSKLTITIGKVRKNKCKPIYEKYIHLVNDTIGELKNINLLLLKKPIDIDTINSIFSNAIVKAKDLDTSINNDLDNYLLVSRCIIFANPLKVSFIEANNALDEINELFLNGNYGAAQEQLNKLLNTYHPAAFSSFKE